jgi:hypothetical protein
VGPSIPTENPYLIVIWPPVLTQYKPELGEEVSAIVSFTRREGEKDVPYICAGFIMWPEGDDKPVTGKLRVFTPVSLNGKRARRELALVTSQDVLGPVYSLKWVNDKLVAAIETVVSSDAPVFRPL